jgi:HSP20 family protein
MTTTLVPWNTRLPSVLETFRREMDRVMNRFFSEEGDRNLRPWLTLDANIAETDKEFEISVDLPGLKPDEFNVEFKDGCLWITGERKQEQEQSGKTYHVVERSYGHFRRVINLGNEVDPDRIQAHYKDGVLTVIVPKAESARPKKIEVKG